MYNPLHTFAQLYTGCNTIPHIPQLYNILQHFTTFTILYKLLQSFTQLLQDFYNFSHNFATPCATLHNDTKLLNNTTTKQDLTKLFAKAYTSFHNSTKPFQHFTQLYKTCTTLYTTLHNVSQLYKKKNFTQLLQTKKLDRTFCFTKQNLTQLLQT